MLVAIMRQRHLCSAVQLGHSAALRRRARARAQALFNLGNLLRQHGEFEGAVECYEGVLAQAPGHWRALLSLSVALIGLAREDAAKKALRAAFKASGAARAAARWGPRRVRARAGRSLAARVALRLRSTCSDVSIACIFGCLPTFTSDKAAAMGGAVERT
jgi:tetratricopeptide (TPR) repeat protein